MWFTLPIERNLTTHYLYIHMTLHVLFVMKLSNWNQTFNYISNKFFYLFWKTRKVECKLCEEIFNLESSLKLYIRGKCTSMKVPRFCNDCANTWKSKKTLNNIYSNEIECKVCDELFDLKPFCPFHIIKTYIICFLYNKHW